MNSSELTVSRNEKGKETVVVDVGEDTRRIARVPVHFLADQERESVEKQWGNLAKEKKELEGKLSKYSKAAIAAAQMRVRKENYGVCKANSIEAWIAEKSKLESERQLLVSRKITIEQEMIRLKPRMRALNQQGDWDEKHMHLELLRSIVFELRDIKELLRRK